MGVTIFYRIFFTFKVNVGNILQNIVNPMEHCYGSAYCYATFTSKFLTTFLDVHTKRGWREIQYLSFMYIMYTNTSNNIPFYNSKLTRRKKYFLIIKIEILRIQIWKIFNFMKQIWCQSGKRYYGINPK